MVLSFIKIVLLLYNVILLVNSFITGAAHSIPLPVEVNTCPDVPVPPPLVIFIVLLLYSVIPFVKSFTLDHAIPIAVEVNTCPGVPLPPPLAIFILLL